ncbi:DNA-binding transcriptional regulator [Puniceicoccaceae bacterium K14]|nr:DNA-binding transcriptional regulator [Puniceicoccaceae bacterium K14]
MKHVLMALGSYDYSAHKGIARFASENKWHLNSSVLKTFQMPHNWNGDGIITSLNNNDRIVQFINEANVPVVDISSWREDVEVPRVTADNFNIGEVAAEHFLEMGHHNFAWFALSLNPVGKERYEGFRVSLKDAGFDLTRIDKSRAQDGPTIVSRLLELPKPCALFCKSDYDAAWICDLCYNSNIKVPEQIAVLGVDNNELICQNQSIPLSSINHNLERIGYEGAAMLESLMNNDTHHIDRKLIKPDGITIRRSTNSLVVTDPLVSETLTYLEKNLHRPISTDDIAEAFGTTRKKIETRFRQQLHSTIRDKLIRMRIEKSKMMLKEGAKPIEDIAALTGFCHASHFSNTFKKLTGMAPTSYKRKSQRQ